MERRERERIMNQGAVRPETPRERRDREQLQVDVADSPLAGQRVEQRLRNFRPDPASYFAALGGPLPYMSRLRAIHVQTEEHEHQLAEAWHELAAEARGDEEEFGRAWRETAERWNFYEVNELITRHNRWYPAEARLPMDPRTGDFVPVNGEDYRRRPLDATWILERFPARLLRARAA
jgi:hypothetical protein